MPQAYAFNGLFVGWHPLFNIPQLAVPDFSAYGWYAALGVAGGVVAAVLPTAFYRARDGFKSLPIPAKLKPAVGGLALGLLAMAVPQILGAGYGWVQQAIDGQLGTRLMLVLVLAKIVGLCLTVSSGGSGGVFAPALYVGGMLGGAFGQLIHQPVAAFVVVGMAAVFAGAARVPIATLLFVTEMTSGFEMLVPAALAVMLSYMVQEWLSSRLHYRSLYEGQVVDRAASPAHQVEQLQAALHLLESGVVVGEHDLDHLNLVQLIQAGVPIELLDVRLEIAPVAADSPLVTRRLDTLVPETLRGKARIIAVLRGAGVEFATGDAVVAAGDGLVILVAPDARAWFDRGLTATVEAITAAT
jgi:CIC family chloride channel protein